MKFTARAVNEDAIQLNISIDIPLKDAKLIVRAIRKKQWEQPAEDFMYALESVIEDYTKNFSHIREKINNG